MNTPQPHGGIRSEPARLAALPGLMMDRQLTVGSILQRMKTVHGSSKVTTFEDADTNRWTSRTFAEIALRAGQLANALAKLGVRPGDRVASLAWNSSQHLEAYLGVMSMGAVLHTANLRLSADQLAYTINHSGSRIVLVDSRLATQLTAVLPQLPAVHTVIEIDFGKASSIPHALDYEAILAAESSEYPWPDLDENAAASLCFTSGTTGNPKGVMYSHRSIVLHALAMSGADAFGIRSTDRVLALVPLFHAMGWGLPFICGLVGSDLVMPGPYLKPAQLVTLIEQSQATWSAGVPTLWLDLLHHVDRLKSVGQTADLSTLKTVLSGGTSIPPHLIRAYAERFGVDVIEGWGMTETFPGATVARGKLDDGLDGTADRRRSAGQPTSIYELRVVGMEGTPLAHDGQTVGEIEVRGPSVAKAYLDAGDAALDKFHDGWLRTGDIGTIDEGGWLHITDRLKDAIKSGGEWIPSVDLENALMAHPSVREAAIVARPDDRWGERPVAFVVCAEQVSVKELQAHLSTQVARWWIPDQYEFVSEIPRTSTGKLNKKLLVREISRRSS